MRNRTFRFGRLVVVAAALLVAGACVPPWTIIRQAVPNPLVGQRQVFIQGVSFQGLVVGREPEPMFLSRKTPEQQASWEADKQAMAQLLSQTLAGRLEGVQVVTGAAPPPGIFVVRPNVAFIEPGNFNGMVNIPTFVNMTVQITDSNGTVVDEFATETRVQSSLFNPSTGGRLRSAAEHLGTIIARYVNVRVSGG